MSTNVDLNDLAIDRGGTGPSRRRVQWHLMTRYALPLALMAGFLALVVGSSRDLIFPPRAVTVVPLYWTTADVQQEGTPLFNAAGWIEPRPTPVRIAALAPGVVETLLVVEDQPVKAGEPVAELVKDDARLVLGRARADARLRDAELKEARSALKAAETRLQHPVHLRAALGESEALLAKTETHLKNVPFDMRRARADLEAAQKEYDGKTASSGVVAGVEIDIARAKSESATALVESLRTWGESLKKEQTALSDRRDALETQLALLADEIKAKEVADAQVQAAMARVEQARVAVAEAELYLNRMTIVAPIDGRVYRLIAHPGARIGSGMMQMAGYDGSTVVTMYRPDQLQVRVDVRFEDIPKVRLDQPVEIDNPALASPLTGRVLFVSSEADIQKNTLQVKVEIPDPPPVFKPEMLVDVTFRAPKVPQSALEPSRALKRFIPKHLIGQSDEGSFVWLADQSEGVARKTVVQTGAASANGLVEITSGLALSSRIIASGSDGLQDGDRIHVTREDAEGGATHETESSTSGPLDRLPATEMSP